LNDGQRHRRHVGCRIKLALGKILELYQGRPIALLNGVCGARKQGGERGPIPRSFWQIRHCFEIRSRSLRVAAINGQEQCRCISKSITLQRYGLV
jgi:hypothetical protein